MCSLAYKILRVDICQLNIFCKNLFSNKNPIVFDPNDFSTVASSGNYTLIVTLIVEQIKLFEIQVLSMKIIT